MDLATRWPNPRLRSPLVSSASPIAVAASRPPARGDGGGPLILPSLFEEQRSEDEPGLPARLRGFDTSDAFRGRPSEYASGDPATRERTACRQMLEAHGCDPSTWRALPRGC